MTRLPNSEFAGYALISDAGFGKYDDRTIAGIMDALLDDLTLAGVLDALASACREKAEHLRSNWQDEASARVWDREARQIDKLTMRQVRTF